METNNMVVPTGHVRVVGSSSDMMHNYLVEGAECVIGDWSALDLHLHPSVLQRRGGLGRDDRATNRR